MPEATATDILELTAECISAARRKAAMCTFQLPRHSRATVGALSSLLSEKPMHVVAAAVAAFEMLEPAVQLDVIQGEKLKFAEAVK